MRRRGMVPGRCAGIALAAWLIAGCVDVDYLAEVRSRPDASLESSTRWSYPNFSSPDGVVLGGSATVVDGILRLTDDIDAERGAAYLEPPVVLTPTSRTRAHFVFRIRLSSPPRSDGLVFMWQNDPRGTAALGAAGGGLGYYRVRPSLAVEFDIHAQSIDDPSENHLAVLRDGNLTRHLAAVAEPGIDFESAAQVHVWIDYDGLSEALSIYVSESGIRPDSPLLTYAASLFDVVGGQAYIGFSAATGERFAAHEVLELHVEHEP